jgi:OOP family OmpA-OmpF porin
MKMRGIKIGITMLGAGLLIALIFAGCATKEPAVVEEEPVAEVVEEAPAEEPAVEEPAEEVAMVEEPEPTVTAQVRDSDGDGVPDDLDRCPDTPAGVRVDASGCPKITGGMLEIQLTLEFDFDSARIKDEYMAERYKIDEFIAANPEAEVVRIDLDGHTCNIGTKSYNYKLSRERALSVRDYLMGELGLGHDFFKINAHGEDRPTASNDSKEGRRRNRRVDVVFVVKNVSL